MTNFRELCDELLDELKFQTDWSIAEELKERARAALAEPEPEGPTDKELAELYRTAYYQCENRQGDAAQVFALRTVLDRWGEPNQ